MTLDKRQQRLAIIAICLVALWGGDRLVFSPLTRSWKARTERLAALRNSVTQGADLLAREADLRERWDRMRTNTLPNQVSVAESQLLKAFDRWSQDSGVSISSIRPQWKQDREECAILECHADAAGNLSSLSRFLYQVERDPLALKVEAIELTARDTAGEQLALTLHLSGLQLLSKAR